MRLYTVTVHNTESFDITTTVHLDKDDVYDRGLRSTYDRAGSHDQVPNEDLIAALEKDGLQVWVKEHDFPDVGILVVGNPSDGFNFIGPYYSESEAADDSDQAADYWFTAKLLEPEGDR